jgi:aspartate-semialdehyde dehydrogenase
MCSEERRIHVVGATGAVGAEALRILAERGVEAARVSASASARSTARVIRYGMGSIEVVGFKPESIDAVDLVLLCTSAAVSLRLAPECVARGAVVVDSSSAFRRDAQTPLVIPEINGDEITNTHGGRLVASPNCSTILLLTALEPLRASFGIQRVVVSTYQAVSGAGFNVFPHESAVDTVTGFNGEEQKIVHETHRIWDDESVEIIPTCVRVPVVRAHSQSVLATLREGASIDDVRDALGRWDPVAIVDDRARGVFPTPLRATGGDRVLVGRVRAADGIESGPTREVCLWLSGDQLRKGAALNAIQIGDLAGGRIGPHLSSEGIFVTQLT